MRQVVLLLIALGAALPAAAQTPPPVATPVIPVTPVEPPPAVAARTSLFLAARFSEGGAKIASGVLWRVFDLKRDATGEMPLVAESDQAQPTFVLEPGVYVVHAGYGLAAATRRIEIGAVAVTADLVLNAGALRVSATVADRPVPAEALTSRIHVIGQGGERRMIADNVPATEPTRLPEGRYFIESIYGASNAMVSAEIEIKAGQLTDATFHHRAAQVTLKLVNEPGGEALANTSWSVLTPGGDVIRESIGAFPSMVLAEGTYSVVARHDGQVFTREFEVNSGKDGDVEVLAR